MLKVQIPYQLLLTIGVYTHAGVLAKIFGVVDFSNYLDSSQKTILLPAMTLNATKKRVMVRDTV